MRKDVLASLDIGTSYSKLLVAKKTKKENKIEILFQGKEKHLGVRRGEIYKIEDVKKSIVKLLSLAKKQGIEKLERVILSIGGSRIYSIESQGAISVSRADQKISQEDIQRVIEQAQAVNLPQNVEILDIFPKEFIVDKEKVIEDPLGLKGVRLELKAVLACGYSQAIENLTKCVEELNLEIEDIIPSPLASARACLSDQAKELGAGIIDLGARTTALAFFEEQKLLGFSILPLGSAKITDDIALGLRIDIQTAERIKREFGGLFLKKGKKEKIELKKGEISFNQKFLKSIITARINQIFSQLEKEIKKFGPRERFPAGIIFTGGGRELPGLIDYAKQKLKLPCQKGTCLEIPEIEDPSFHVCAGLLLLFYDQKKEKERSKTFFSKIKRLLAKIIP